MWVLRGSCAQQACWACGTWGVYIIIWLPTRLRLQSTLALQQVGMCCVRCVISCSLQCDLQLEFMAAAALKARCSRLLLEPFACIFCGCLLLPLHARIRLGTVVPTIMQHCP